MGSIEERVKEIEKNLVEQEHRPIHVISNYFFRKKKWPTNEGLQIASKKALIWRLFFSPAVIAGTGGIVAIITIGVLVWQTKVVIDQNDIIQEQNIFFRQQILSDQMSANKTIYQSKDSLDSAVRVEALLEYISAKKAINPENNDAIKVTGINLALYSFSEGDSILFKNIIFENINFRGARFLNIDFKNVKFIGCKFQGFSLDNYYMNFAGLPRFTVKGFIPTVFKDCKFNLSKIVDSRYDGSIFNNCEFNTVTMVGQLMRYSSFIKCNFLNGKPNFLTNENLENRSFDNINSAIEELRLQNNELKLQCFTLYEKDIGLYEYDLPSHNPSVVSSKSDKPYISMRLYDYDNFEELPELVEEMKTSFGQSRSNFITGIYLDLDKSEIYKSQANILENINGQTRIVE
tara:strand:- start:4223 stop:5434 length:1212 start_codon:yes stop_codon:yes gene_type:complete